jgi:hypothetical protein
MSRERNKEHARSTRRRKKIFENTLHKQLNLIRESVSFVFKGETIQRISIVNDSRIATVKMLFELLVNHLTCVLSE